MSVGYDEMHLFVVLLQALTLSPTHSSLKHYLIPLSAVSCEISVLCWICCLGFRFERVFFFWKTNCIYVDVATKSLLNMTLLHHCMRDFNLRLRPLHSIWNFWSGDFSYIVKHFGGFQLCKYSVALSSPRVFLALPTSSTYRYGRNNAHGFERDFTRVWQETCAVVACERCVGYIDGHFWVYFLSESLHESNPGSEPGRVRTYYGSFKSHFVGYKQVYWHRRIPCFIAKSSCVLRANLCWGILHDQCMCYIAGWTSTSHCNHDVLLYPGYLSSLSFFDQGLVMGLLACHTQFKLKVKLGCLLGQGKRILWCSSLHVSVLLELNCLKVAPSCF